MSYRQQGYRPSTPGRVQQSRSASGTAGARAGTHPARAASSPVRPGAAYAPKPYRAAPKKAAKRTSARRRRHPIRNFMLLLLFAFIATVGVVGYLAYDQINSVERENTFFPGVYVNGVELNGATPQQAYEELLSRARSSLSGWQIDLRFGSDLNWSITPDTLGMNSALDSLIQEAVTQAYYIGRSGDNILERYRTISGLKSEPVEISIATIDKNLSLIDGILSEIQNALYIPAKDATNMFDFNRRDPVVIADEEYGREADVELLKSQIIERVNNMQAGTIDIPTKEIVPQITRAMLSDQVMQLASFRTQIASYSTADRNRNVQRGVDAFHGKVFRPGQKVSFNEVVGKRTIENGFFPALEVVSGAYEEGIGGGICQVSSTLYNAVIQAGLEVVKRSPHGIPVAYVELGADATVSDRGIDFVFRNNTDADIYIIANFVEEGKNKYCEFKIYGKPDPNGYRYSLAHETIKEIPIPAAKKIPDKKQEHVRYTDQTYEASKGAVGYKVRTYLVTRDSNGVVINQKELYVDEYAAQAPVIYVGVEHR